MVTASQSRPVLAIGTNAVRMAIGGMSRNRNFPADAFSIVIAGISVGWLVGLSVSPIVQAVVSSLLALIAAFVAAITGISVNERNSASPVDGDKIHRIKRNLPIKPLPIAMLVLSIAGGASIGVYARTHAWLGVRPQEIVQKWKDLGLDEQETKRRIFEYEYPVRQEDSAARPSSVAGLYLLTSDECDRLRLKEGDSLRTYLKTFRGGILAPIVDDIETNERLLVFKQLLCSDAKQ